MRNPPSSGSRLRPGRHFASRIASSTTPGTSRTHPRPDHPVLEEIKRRLGLLKEGSELRGLRTKLGLVVERRGKILDMDFLIDEVMTSIKSLPIEGVMQSRSRLFVSITNAADGTGRVVDVKTESPPVVALLKATAA